MSNNLTVVNANAHATTVLAPLKKGQFVTLNPGVKLRGQKSHPREGPYSAIHKAGEPRVLTHHDLESSHVRGVGEIMGVSTPLRYSEVDPGSIEDETQYKLKFTLEELCCHTYESIGAKYPKCIPHTYLLEVDPNTNTAVNTGPKSTVFDDGEVAVLNLPNNTDLTFHQRGQTRVLKARSRVVIVGVPVSHTGGTRNKTGTAAAFYFVSPAKKVPIHCEWRSTKGAAREMITGPVDNL